jgi:hypothetical protein
MSQIMNRITNTPWGEIQSVQSLNKSVMYVTTAGHGGFGVLHGSKEYFKLSPAAFAFSRQYCGDLADVCGYQWFEEDHGQKILAQDLPELFPHIQPKEAA